MRTHLRNVASFAPALLALMFNASAVRLVQAAAFQATDSLTTGGRIYHTATLLPNGKVLVAGGSPVSDTELYDPATETWGQPAPLNPARHLHTATLLGNGKVLVAGGIAGSSVTADARLYDPAGAGTWMATQPLNIGRFNHTATLLPNGKVLVVGGQDENDAILDSAELYDPATGMWQPTSTSLEWERYLHTATLLSNGKVLVAGGVDSLVGTIATAELYDPAVDGWLSGGSLQFARYSHTATVLPDGKVLFAGGMGIIDNLDRVELYDPTTGTWAETGSLNNARGAHSATLLPNGKVLVAGGQGTGWPAPIFSSAELYDPNTGTWTLTDSMDTARALHTATLLPTCKVLVVAGTGGSGLDSAELYTPDPSIVSFPLTLGFSQIILKYGTLTWKRDNESSTLDVIFYPKVAFQLAPFKQPMAQGGLGRLPIIGEMIVFSELCCSMGPPGGPLENCMFTMCFDVSDLNLVATVTQFRVLSFSDEDDWVVCEATVPHHYDQEGVYEAGFYACTRPSNLGNRAGHAMEVHVKLDTRLPVGAGTTREKIDMPPVLWVWPDGNGEARFRVPTAAPPTYSSALGSQSETGHGLGDNCCYKAEQGTGPHPPNLEHIGNGEFRWPLPFDGICSFLIGGDWTTQVQIADSNPPQLKTMADFILKVSYTGRNKIQWLDAPPPVINVEAGCMVHFNLLAQHAGYSGGQFTITSTALPYGAIVNPFHPSTVKNQASVSSAFAWLPTASQVGSHIIHFIAGNTASDPAAESRAYASVIINVSSSGPVVTALANKQTAELSTAGRFAVYRSCASASPLTVNYSVAGSAAPGLDYTALPGSVTIPSGATVAYINVTPITDGLLEGIETVQITLLPNGSAYQLSSTSVAIVNITNHFCSASSYDPVAWWKGNGNGQDSVGGSHGQLNPGVTFTRGIVEDAFCFPDGSSAYSRVQPSSSVDVGSGPGMTIECWIRPSDVGFENQPLVVWSKDGNTTVTLYLSDFSYGAGSLFALVLGTTGGGIIYSDPGIYPIVDGEWQHVALTYDRATGVARLYRNGVPIAEPQQPWGDFRPDTSSATLDLGGFPDLSQFYRGQMDEITLYKGALSSTEILAIYNAGSSGKGCP